MVCEGGRQFVLVSSMCRGKQLMVNSLSNNALGEQSGAAVAKLLKKSKSLAVLWFVALKLSNIIVIRFLRL